MPRRKAQTGLVEDRRARVAAYTKRKEGLKKKARELATLCGVPVALVCGGVDVAATAGAEVWESEDGVLARYRALPAETRAQHTHLRYVEAELGKERAKLARLRQDGALASWDASLDGITAAEAAALLEYLDAALRATAERRKALGLPDRDGDDGLDLQHIPPLGASFAAVPLGHGGVQCGGGSSSANVSGDYQQMMPAAGDGGSSDQHYASLGLGWGGAYQPRNDGTAAAQPVYDFRCAGGGSYNYLDTHGYYQMQVPGNGNGNIHSSWPNLSMWSAGEPSNAAAPPVIGYPAPTLRGHGNFIFLAAQPEHLALRTTGGDLINAPADFLGVGIGGSSMDVSSYSTQSSGDGFQLQLASASPNQLHYLSDVNERMRFGYDDTQPQPQQHWGN